MCDSSALFGDDKPDAFLSPPARFQDSTKALPLNKVGLGPNVKSKFVSLDFIRNKGLAPEIPGNSHGNPYF
jgi:hypothetical protein